MSFDNVGKLYRLLLLAQVKYRVVKFEMHVNEVTLYHLQEKLVYIHEMFISSNCHFSDFLQFSPAYTSNKENNCIPNVNIICHKQYFPSKNSYVYFKAFKKTTNSCIGDNRFSVTITISKHS